MASDNAADTAPSSGKIKPVDAHAFDFLLKTFGFINEAGEPDKGKFCDWLDKKGGFLHGKALLDGMFEKHADDIGLKGEKRQTLKGLLDFAASPDEGLGCTARPWRDAYVEALQTYNQHQMEQTDKGHAAIVQLDFRNMANTNDALGRQQVNRIMRVMTTIFETVLKGDPKELATIKKLLGVEVACTDPSLPKEMAKDRRGQNVGVTTIRPGGDEVEFEITGLWKHGLNERMRLANNACDTFLGYLGGTILPCLEYKKRPADKGSAGFGVGMGAFAIDDQPQASLDSIQNTLDTEIKKHKETTGRERERKHGKRWEPLSAEEVRQQLPQKRVERMLGAAERSLGIPAEKEKLSNMTPWPAELVLPDTKDGKNLDLYEAQKEAEQKFCTSLDSSEQKQFTENLGMLVNERDPLTGYKAAHMLPKSLDYLEQHCKKPLVLAELELSNLVSLNAMFGIAGANKVMTAVMDKIMMPYLEEKLGEDFSVSRDAYYAGGSRVRLLLRDIPIERIQETLGGLAAKMKADINDQTLGDFLNTMGLSELPLNEGYNFQKNQKVSSITHPKKDEPHVSDATYKPRRGFELFYAAIDIDMEKTLPSKQNISLVEALKESYEVNPRIIKQQAKEQNFIRNNTNQWLAGNGNSTTGLINGLPDLLYNIIVEKDYRLGRGHYLGILVPGKIALQGGDDRNWRQRVEAPISNSIQL